MTGPQRQHLRALIDQRVRALTAHDGRTCVGCGILLEDYTRGCQQCNDRRNRRERRQCEERREAERAQQRADKRRAARRKAQRRRRQADKAPA